MRKKGELNLNGESIKRQSNYPIGYKICFILLCSFLTGFLWRLRGDHGWGGMAGMTAVATGLLLTIITFIPYRKKVNLEIIPLAIFMTAITNSGWGTLNSQITGMLVSSTEAPAVNISPYSGIAAMLLLGFGWAPFLALFIGFYLSDKKPKFYHFIIVIALYFATEYVTKATISHLAAKVICPDGVSAFENALSEAGINATPFKAYLSHYNNMSWAKKIAFGRNYFQIVETSSQFFASAATILYTCFIMKDKLAAKVQTSVCISIGSAITLADLFIFFADGGIRNSLENIPAWLTGWSNWEYWTGFFVGLFISVIILKVISNENATEEMTPPVLLPDKIAIRFIRNLVVLCFPVISSVALPLAERFTYKNDVIFRSVEFSDDKILCIPFAVAAVLLMIYPALRITKAETEKGEAIIFGYAGKWLIGMFAMYAFAYFFTGNAYILNGSLTDISITTYISAVIIIAMLILLFRMKKKA